ncbi:hypothetical protein BJS_03839 [Bradyrhizobium japonicum SEMIA 5079]|nr:hypothetical protein BJS_03839 [Bradyrhizobium japonicum SEMIA 5079]
MSEAATRRLRLPASAMPSSSKLSAVQVQFNDSPPKGSFPDFNPTNHKGPLAHINGHRQRGGAHPTRAKPRYSTFAGARLAATL